MNAELEHILSARGVHPTANRLLVLSVLHRDDRAYSLTDLEAVLGTVDKSSIYRVLSLFLEHHVVHSIDDGTGQTKYALCEDDCRCGEHHHDISDLHTHFFCERCQRTYCLRNVSVPEVELPEGFHLHSANYVLKGLCPDCQRYGCHQK